MQQHRAQAIAERDKLNQRIAALDVLIDQELSSRSASPATVIPRKRAVFVGSPEPTQADHVVRALDAAGRALSISELSAKIKEVSGVEITDRQLGAGLPRMLKEGKVARPSRGMYAVPPMPDSPALGAGLSVVPNQ